MKKLSIMLLLIIGVVVNVNAQKQDWFPSSSSPRSQFSTATLTIWNRSVYSLTVKIMRTNGRGLYQTVYVGPQSSRCVSFSNSDTFYTKTKAEKAWEGTLYRMGSIFQIQNDSEGYSEASLTFFVSSSGGTSGKGISKSEFEKDF